MSHRGRRFPVLGLLLILCACSSSTTPAPEAAPSKTTPGVQTDPGSPTGSGSLAEPPPVPGLILWLEQLTGYVPAEVAEKANRYPLRFALHDDGSLVYRNDRFQHYKVQLKPEEVEKLLGQVVDTGFLDLGELFENPEESTVIVDGGAEIIGVRWAGRARTVNLTGGARFLAQYYPGNPRVQTAKKVRDLLYDYTHPGAIAHQP